MSSSRKILAIDSSTELCSVCWTDGSRWIERREDAGQRHSALMLSMIGEALAEARCTVADLDEIAFGAGPGSFTGLRIACGIAQGLAFGAGIRVRAVSSLMALAEASAQASVIAAIDARMNEVYWAAYKRERELHSRQSDARSAPSGVAGSSDGKWVEIIPPTVSPAADVVLPSGDNWAAAGNGFARFASLAAAMPATAIVDAAIEVNARSIASLAMTGHGTIDVAEHATPVYIRDKVAMTSAERAAARR